jgi:uncharacterized protein
VQSICNFIKRHPVLGFFSLTYIASSLGNLAIYLSLPNGEAPVSVERLAPITFFFLFLGAASSGITGFVLTGSIDGRQGIRKLLDRFRRWKVSIIWYLSAIFTAPVTVIIVLLAMMIAISPNFLPAILTGENVVILIVVAVVLGLLSGFIEEWGWTGFALPRLLARYPVLSSAFWLGVGWSLWHAVLILWILPIFPRTGTVLDILGGILWLGALIPYRILMSWVYINGKASLFVAIVMHACYNASFTVLLPRTLAPIELVQFYAAVNIILWVFVGTIISIFGTRSLARVDVTDTMKALEPTSIL